MHWSPTSNQFRRPSPAMASRRVRARPRLKPKRMEVRCNKMPTPMPQPERENYLNKEYGVWSWLLTTDHKRIALLYLLSITFFFFIGGFFALLIRLELLTPAG